MFLKSRTGAALFEEMKKELKIKNAKREADESPEDTIELSKQDVDGSVEKNDTVDPKMDDSIITDKVEALNLVNGLFSKASKKESLQLLKQIKSLKK